MHRRVVGDGDHDPTPPWTSKTQVNLHGHTLVPDDSFTMPLRLDHDSRQREIMSEGQPFTLVSIHFDPCQRCIILWHARLRREGKELLVCNICRYRTNSQI